MRGRVLIYNNDTKRGVIQDDKDNRYDFHIGEWLSEEPIIVGEVVDFEIPREDAINISVNRGKSFLSNFIEKGKKLFGIRI